MYIYTEKYQIIRFLWLMFRLFLVIKVNKKVSFLLYS